MVGGGKVRKGVNKRSSRLESLSEGNSSAATERGPELAVAEPSKARQDWERQVTVRSRVTRPSQEI